MRTEQNAIQQGHPGPVTRAGAHGEGVRGHALQGPRARLGNEVEPTALAHRGQIEDGLGEDSVAPGAIRRTWSRAESPVEPTAR